MSNFLFEMRPEKSKPKTSKNPEILKKCIGFFLEKVGEINFGP